jgi:hypothetical protein
MYSIYKKYQVLLKIDWESLVFGLLKTTDNGKGQRVTGNKQHTTNN